MLKEMPSENKKETQAQTIFSKLRVLADLSITLSEHSRKIKEFILGECPKEKSKGERLGKSGYFGQVEDLCEIISENLNAVKENLINLSDRLY